MNDKFFLDTNIVVYSFDTASPAKRDISRALISNAISSGNGMVSFQVVQEFCNVALQKFKKPLSAADMREFLECILMPLCAVFPSGGFYSEALDVRERTGYSFYDSMIIQAALEADCGTLFSEDMQDGFKLFSLTIKNPFK